MINYAQFHTKWKLVTEIRHQYNNWPAITLCSVKCNYIRKGIKYFKFLKNKLAKEYIFWSIFVYEHKKI